MGNLKVNFQADGSAIIDGTITGQSLAGKVVNFSGALFTVSAANISGVTTAFLSISGGALADSFSGKAEWVAQDIADAFKAGARAAERYYAATPAQGEPK